MPPVNFRSRHKGFDIDSLRALDFKSHRVPHPDDDKTIIADGIALLMLIGLDHVASLPD